MSTPREPIPGIVYPPADKVDHYLSVGALTTEPLPVALAQSFAEHADRIALITPEKRYSYAELDAITDRLAAGLLDLGLGPRDRALFQFTNVAEVAFAFYACLKIGVIPICSIANHREAEIGFLADFCEAKVHFVQGDLPRFDMVEFANRMRAEKPVIRHTVVGRDRVTGGALAMDALIEGQDRETARRKVQAIEHDPFQSIIFQLSGGTTGIPKAIPRFSAEYLYNARICGQSSGIDARSVVLWPLPFMHNAAMICYTLPVHLAGGALIMQADYSAEALLETIQREKVTVMGIGQPMLIRIADSGLRPNYDLSSVTACESSARIDLVEEVLGVPGYQRFGMAEGMIVRTAPEDPPEVRYGALGQPLSPWDEFKILEPGTDTPVPDGEVGEYCARGPYTIHGYFRAEEHNAKAFTSDGYYRSGDLMRSRVVEGKRRLWFVGRHKDVVNRGGEKINADEVEQAVAQHPAVRDVALVALPDREFGERACACIVLKDGATAPSIAELGAFLGTKGLAKFKWPERIELMDNFPVTKVGKPSKALMRDMIVKQDADALDGKQTQS